MKIRKLSFLIIACYLFFLAGCATVPRSSSTAVSSALQDQVVAINGISYVPLMVVCDRFDFKWSWDPVLGKAAIQNAKGLRVKFLQASKYVLINDKSARMDGPAILYHGAFMVPVLFIQDNILPPQFKATQAYPQRARAVPAGKYLLNEIVIDAGHGGKDPGAIGRQGLREKDVALDIAKRVKRILEAAGFKVYMTRSNDKFIPLARRSHIANSCGADFFVSIHVNASKSKKVKGFEVYYLAEAADESAQQLAERENASLKFEESSFKVNSSNNLEGILWDLVSTENRAESIQLANDICREARKSLWVCQRGVKSAKFFVLKGSRMPAILAEVGFISNKDEEVKLSSPAYRESAAKAIASGILLYRDQYQQAEGFTK